MNWLKSWNTFSYPIKDNFIISNELISKAIESLWDKHVNNIKDTQHIIALFRLKSADGAILSLGTMCGLGKHDKNFYINQIESILHLKSEEYNSVSISEIIISFGVREGIAPINKIINSLWSDININNYNHSSRPALAGLVSILIDPVFLISFVFVVIFIIFNYYAMDSKWWIKFFIGFAISFVITVTGNISKNNKMESYSSIVNFFKKFV